MHPLKLPRWPLLFAVLLAAGLLVLTLHGVKWGEMLVTIRRGHPQYLLFGFAVLTLSNSIRALRWRILLSAEKRIAPITVFWAASLGYLGNYVLPLRAGEIIRSVALSRVANIRMPYVLATALTERIIDLMALLLISLLSLMSFNTLPGWMLSAVKIMTVLGCSGLLGILAAPHLEPILRKLLARLPISTLLFTRLQSLLEQALLGLRALQHPGRSLSFIGLTTVVWLLDTVVALEVAAAFSVRLTPAQALLLLAALGLSSAAPSTPGYVGIYQFVAVTVLVPFGMSRSTALVFILAFQAVIYAVVFIWGTLGLLRLYVWLRPAPLPVLPLETVRDAP